MTAKEKIAEYLDTKGISKSDFYKKTGLSQGFLNSGKTIGLDKAKIIINEYPDLNLNWFVMDEGEMIVDEKILRQSSPYYSPGKTKRSAPYFNSPVQAGSDTQIFSIDTDPNGHIEIPGVRAIAFFPVIGFSMEPTIRNGDIIGIDEIDSWERMDPDKIYYIITDSDRMIKHLRSHNGDEDVLICISPNYKEFLIRKENVKAIYRVVFYGRIA